MLTKKEKCIEALGYLFNHAHNCTNCDRVNICCDDCEKDNTMECDIAYVRLDNLIEEHFELLKVIGKVAEGIQKVIDLSNNKIMRGHLNIAIKDLEITQDELIGAIEDVD